MRAGTGWLLGFGVGGAALACAFTLGEVRPGRGDGGAADGAVVTDVDASGAAAVTCAAPSRCLAPPVGWEGPFAVAFAGGSPTALSCASAFARAWERTGLADGGAPAQCSCACGSLAATCRVDFAEYGGKGGCSGNPTSLTPMGDGGCLQNRNASGVRGLGTITQQSCPALADASVSPLGAASLAIGCVGATPGGCDAGACTPPTPTGSRLCVRAPDGADARACPEEYPEPVALPAGVEDTRGCSPCTCVPNAVCTPTVEYHDPDDCSEGRVVYTSTTCVDRGGTDSVRLRSVAITGACTPSGGAPSGGVAPRPASTLCCAR